MTTWFVSPEDGTNSNASAGNGDSYATRRKFLQNVVAAAVAPGDEIRMMGSPAPTSLGVTGVWTDGPQPAGYTPVSSTNATPIVLTISGANYTAMAPAVNDTVVVTGHTTNTKANGVWKISAVNGTDSITLVNADGSNSVGNGVGGATGTVRKITNAAVTLASALTQNVALFGNQGTKTNWTPSANVTATVITSDFKEGGECQQLDIAAGFTTGLAAYFATSTLDLSGYQQLSFWIKQTAGTIGAAGSVQIKLCSDTAGATPVNTFDVPLLGALNRWSPITVDLATNLGASIQSISFNVVTDNGAQTFLLDNIIACKASSSADSLSLTSLIGKNTGNETFWGIQSINGTRVLLDMNTNQMPTNTSAGPQRGYSGTTETVTTYKRETIKTPMAATATASVQATQENGTPAAPITITGGWNRTDMSTQTLETWLDGQNGLGVGLFVNHIDMLIDKIAAVRYDQGIATNTAAHRMGFTEIPAANNNTTYGVFLDRGDRINVGTIKSVCANGIPAASSHGMNISQCSRSVIGNILAAHGNGLNGVILSNAIRCSVTGSLVAKNNGQTGLSFGACADDNIINGYSSSGNASGSVSFQRGNNTLRNSSFSEATPAVSLFTGSDGLVKFERYGGVADDHRAYGYFGQITSELTERHTPSGMAWKFYISATTRDANMKLDLPLGPIGCVAGVPVSVRIWTRRDNTNIKGRLFVRAGQLGGVPEMIVACEPSIDTWVRSDPLTFTPTETGALEVLFQVWDGVGALNSYYVDDLEIS